MYQVRGNGFGQHGGGPAGGGEDWEDEISGEKDGGIESGLEKVNLERVAQTFVQPEPTQDTEKDDNGVSYEEDGAMIIEVPSEDIRRIIGRGGSKIKELQSESGCRIKISKERDDGVTAGIELVGSEDAQNAAHQMIKDVVASSQSGGRGNSQSGFGSSKNQGGFGGSRGGFHGRNEESNEDMLEVEISSRDIAKVIGRGGSKIRELQDESSTRIHINKERDNGVTAVVEIRGDDEGQQIAKQLIEDLTSGQTFGGSAGAGFSRGRNEGGSRQGGFGDRGDWGGDSLEMEVASRDVSRIIGRGGSRIQEMQERSGTRIKINKDRDDGVTTVVEIRGSEDGQQMAKQLIEDLTASQNSYGSGNDGYGRGRGDSRFGRGGQNDWAGEALEIEVSSSDVSRIIGKRGSRIQEMQDKSGTRIKVNKETDDGVTTVIEIRGSEDGQHMAKELIEELTASQDNYNGDYADNRNGDMG